MTVIDFPAGQVANIMRSSFYRVDRVARSRSIFSPNVERQDFGPIWRASVTVATPQAGRDRYAFEAFLRSLRGGVNHVRVWDFDYAKIGPFGTGRSHGLATSQSPHPVNWTTGATWSGAAAVWQYTGALVAGEPVVPGQTSIRLHGGAPGEEIAAVGDTISIGSGVALVDAAPLSDALGRLTVTVDAGHKITAAVGDAATVGAPLKITMELVNRDAAANETGVDRRASYKLELIEVLDA